MADGPRRILIVRPSALGDVARTAPALASLKRAFPEARIDWLVNDVFAGAITHHPDLSEAVPFPRSEFKRRPGMVFGYMRGLRRRGYDTVYDLQGLARSGWLTWSTRAPRRVGPADARELGWLAYNTRVRIDPGVVHTVDRMMAVVAGEGIDSLYDMRLYVGEEDREWAQRILAKHSLEPERFAVVAPTAKWLSKRWPAERFDRVIEELGMAVALVGSEGERASVGSLVRSGRLDLMGQTSVGKLMALIALAGLVIANDSAALHLAVGLGRRCVGVFGPTDPARVGPYRYPAGVVAADGAPGLNYRTMGDDQSLIATVPVDRVLETIRHVLCAPPPQTVWPDSRVPLPAAQRL